jgi:ribose/xylose/arabinose/galactoside ABC-type transport system permease subunit
LTIVALSLIATTIVTSSSNAAQMQQRNTVTGTHGEILNVSQATKISAGATLVVTGQHFDETVGIYVAMCTVVPVGQLPTPCGGGADMTGNAGASAWISSNPPTYGVGLAKPYLPGGRFAVKIKVSPIIKDGTKVIDCRTSKCAIYTRADHTRGDNRSYDFFIPITFK